MSGDLIANNFTAGVNIRLIKKVVLLIKFLFCLNLIYHIAELYMWYVLISKTLDYDMSLPANLYNYRIQPVVIVLLCVLNVIGYLMNIKSFSLMSRSIDESDAALFNRGYSLLYKVIVLTIFTMSIGIINAIIILILK